MSEEHSTFIKTPRQLITVVVLAFVVPVLLIVLLVKFVGSGARVGAGADAMTPEAIEARIQPVAKFVLKDASGPKELRAGADVYKAVCAACHETGAAGAPKFGDAGAWAPRIATGYDALLKSVLGGKGAMPKQSGGEFDDVEIGRAVVHMTNAAGGKFEEPKVPAAAASAPAGAPASAAAPAAAAGPAAAAAPTAAATSSAAPATSPAASPAPAAAAAAAPAAAAPAADAGKGKALYDTSCMVCHAVGVAGAPKFGDKAAWAPRIATGIDAMTASVISGKGAMPPKAGTSASDADLRAAVEYMAAAAK